MEPVSKRADKPRGDGNPGRIIKDLLFGSRA
jgi:hypothetical protein